MLQAEASGPFPSSLPLVKVGAAALVLCWSSLPQPSPHARVTATAGGAKHAAFTPSISSLPDNFYTIHLPTLPRKLNLHCIEDAIEIEQLYCTAALRSFDFLAPIGAVIVVVCYLHDPPTL